MKKNVLITGAAGFIGFHVAKHLHTLGDHVIGYDNFNAYYDPLLKQSRANELKKIGIEIIRGDLQQLDLLQQIVEKHQITHLLHLAAQAGVRYSLENPKTYLESNIDGFLNVLEICRQFPRIPLIYASSSSVYGLNQKVPFDTQDPTDHQVSLYGVTKKTNELMAHSYHHLFGISVTGLRFFTVYGPWGRPDMAYFLFTKAILENKPIRIFNQGDMQRDFTYIDDIVRGTTAALNLSSPYALFNLGNHHPEDLLYLISLIEKELGKEAQKQFLPMQSGDVKSTYANIDESIKQLNFIPQTSLAEGIAKFVAWYKEYYQIN